MSDLRDRLGRLPLERRVKFLALLRSGQAVPIGRPTRRDRGETAPLSYSQDLLWFLDRLSPGMSAYNISAGIWMRGTLDPKVLESALRTVVARHETLRTSLQETESGPIQRIAPTVQVDLAVTDLPGPDVADRRAQCRELAREQAGRPFDLETTPLWRAALYRTAPDEYYFAWIVHHSIFDGTSSELFIAEVAELYGAAMENRKPILPEVPFQFADFAIWEREWLSGSQLDRLLSYWQENLRDLPVVELPTDHPRPEQFTYRGAFSRKRVDSKVVSAVHQLAREMDTTPYTIYVSVFLTVLQRYTHQDDLVVGCSTSVRGRLELESLLGFFVNMMPLRVDMAGDLSFRELIRQVDGVVRNAISHVELPFERMVQAVAPVRDPSRAPLVQNAFLLPQQRQSMPLHGIQVEFEAPEPSTAKFDTTWQMYEAGDESSIDVEYCVDLFDADTVDAMQAHYLEVLGALVADPDSHASRSQLLPAAYREEVLSRWNGQEMEIRDIALDAWFAQQARNTPEAIAVVAGAERLNYRELDERANQVAWLLAERGVSPGDVVGLCLPRGLEYPVAVLGVLKAGAAFVPLDPGHPRERTAVLLGDAAPRAVVTLDRLVAGLPADGPAVLSLDGRAGELSRLPGDRPPAVTSPKDLAYVLYTSGSTGTPKGVLVEHRAVVNFIGATQELFELTSDDHVLAYASYTFDVSVFEMFAALLTGAELHVALDTDRLDVDRLQHLLKESGISVIDLPPTVMSLLDPASLDRLRISFVGGEAFSGDLVNTWNKVSRFFNGYGPTECTVTMLVQECQGHWDASPPIGLPIANHVAHVLDDHLQPVPYGAPGELVIGGEGLARGYLNEPGLTREKFIEDPFGTAPGGRLYRTGDLVKRRRDGAIVFLGRIDRQIKVRGVRIEPGEVEAALLALPQVRQAHVRAWRDQRGQQALVAHVAVPSGPEPSPDEIRGAVADRLPQTMVPQYVVVVPELPLTASGKVDQNALPDPSGSGPAGGTEPRTEMERAIAEELFAPVLQVPSVDVFTGFFEMGGSSLQAAQLISGIRRRFEVEVGVADFFQDPTVAGLAVLVERQRVAALADDELLDLLEQMSDGEVERIMGTQAGPVTPTEGKNP
ncbi:amino acid adenylation domain-containing protein [Streptomyces sp. NPDC016172]|uniref:non-ribosomal peptide synthetase n=1 Tax=Streptomyces sp. NPDC016172 TaxID=3364964 RepID=UPI0036F86C96